MQKPPKKGKMRQNHIAEVYKAIRDLHKDAALQEEASGLRLRDDVDVFYIVELFAADVAGYAQSVISGWRRASAERPLKSLRDNAIFENQEFCEWSSKESKAYPNFINYVKMNDYLRLLVIEYLLVLSNSSKQKR
jgi:hypothetical protein